jgi:hypothetical protein
MSNDFVMRADERGFQKIPSTGPTAAYVSGHPDAFITRWSSFNFHEYQGGRPGFGRIRVFGDETFNKPGCGYSMHPHHNFVICAFVLQGTLLHVNTIGKVDELKAGDFYAFSAGSGGKHTELNIEDEPMRAIYIWMLPDELYLPPTYQRAHFNQDANLNKIVTLAGQKGIVPLPQDVKVSRLVADGPRELAYEGMSDRHGLYTFVLEGELTCGGTLLGHRDSKGISRISNVPLKTGNGKTDVLFVESIM